MPEVTPGLILVVGKRFSGKSHFLRILARKAALRNRLILVHDPMNDWVRWNVKEPMPPNVEIFANVDADDLADYAIEKRAPCTVIYDELRLALPLNGSKDDSAQRIVYYGRHDMVSLVGGSQRPCLIGSDIRALCTTFVCFSITHKRDLAWIAENIDEDIALKAPMLKQDQFLVWPKYPC
jgi:hypothetical protein